MKNLMLVLALLALRASADQVGEAVHAKRVAAEPPGEVMIGSRVEVPMDFAQHVPVLEAKVNGKGPFRFAFDTGFAGVMMMSPDLVKQLGLKVVGETVTRDPSGRNMPKI